MAGRAPIPFPEKSAAAVLLGSNQLKSTTEKRRNERDDDQFQNTIHQFRHKQVHEFVLLFEAKDSFDL